MAKKKDTVEDALEAFALAEESESENRTAAHDDLRFGRLAEQWPEVIKREREFEGRPCLTINKIPAFIRQVVNDARLNKPAIKIHPADSMADPQTAAILDGLIRHIEVASSAGVAYDTAIDMAASCGFGYIKVATEYTSDDAFELDLLIKRVANPFSIYGDPDSEAADSSDWNTAFEIDHISRDEFERKYKDAEAVNWDALGYSDLKAPWSEGKDKIQIARWWRREKVKAELLLLQPMEGEPFTMFADDYEDKKDELDALGVVVSSSREASKHLVTHTLLTGAEVLEEGEWEGKYIPLIPVYGEEINVGGKRYLRSLIRDAKDPQQMFNYWRTMSTELVALAPKAPFIGARGQFKTDTDKWATANTKSHAFIEYDPVQGASPPMRQPFAGIPAGALQEALNASDDMKAVTGIYDASLGARSNETSGIAISNRDRQGDVSTFHFVDNLSRAIAHTGRILIDLAPKVYQVGRMIRVLGQDKKATTIPLGKPAQVAPNGAPLGNDQQGNPLTRIYDIGLGKYDVTVETGPSFTTRRQEAATQMSDLIRAFPAAAPVIGPRLAKNLDWPEADEIADELQAMVQGSQQQAAPQQDPAAMMQVQADAEKARMDAQLKAKELEIKEFEAVTDRMEAQLRIQADQNRALISSDPRQGQFK